MYAACDISNQEGVMTRKLIWKAFAVVLVGAGLMFTSPGQARAAGDCIIGCCYCEPDYACSQIVGSGNCSTGGRCTGSMVGCQDASPDCPSGGAFVQCTS
jgi:hypothetical protein